MRIVLMSDPVSPNGIVFSKMAGRPCWKLHFFGHGRAVRRLTEFAHKIALSMAKLPATALAAKSNRMAEQDFGKKKQKKRCR